MGLENNSGKLTYANIKKGKIAIKGTDGAIHEYDSVTGFITGVEFKDDEYEGQKYRKLCLTITDGDDRFLLQMRTDSGYYRALSMAIPNADLKKSVKITPNYKVVDSKKQTTIFVNQGGDAIKWFWTKDNKGELPQLQKTKFKGKDVYDNTEQLQWLENMWLTSVKPHLISSFFAAPATEFANKPASVPGHFNNDIEEPLDDLPF